MDEIDDPEASYRRGYAQGSWDVIQAVLPLLSEHQRAKLDGWHQFRVSGWRYQNKSQRGPGSMITHAIVPPRQYLKLD